MEHNIPDSHLVQIGDITVSFALLEYQIRFLIISLIDEQQGIGQVIVAELSFKNLIALAINLYKEKYGEDEYCNTIEQLMKEAAKIEETRNQITHSAWGIAQNSQKITRIKTVAKQKNGLQHKFEKLSAIDLKKIAKDIKDLTSKIFVLYLNLLKDGKTFNSPTIKR